METRRKIIYSDEYASFHKLLPTIVQRKILYVLRYIACEERIPVKFFKHIEGVKGLYEVRIEIDSNIYRIFCCMDKGSLVILLNGFHKKSDKTPSNEIDRAIKLMSKYFNNK